MNFTSVHAQIDKKNPDEQLDDLNIGLFRGDDKKRVQCTRQSLASLVDFITYNQKLQHLDISYMGLGDKILEVCDSILLNHSLLAVHFGDNYMS